MLDLGAVAAYSIAAGLLTLTPGLDTALVLRTAAVRLALAGICMGLLIWGTATALGLTALMAVSAVAYFALRIAGAVYLIYLGIQMWRRKHTFQVGAGQKRGVHSWLLRGLLTNLLNPKVGVFYVTLMPQFIPRGGSIIGYSLLYACIHVVEGVAWLTALTVAVTPLRAWLTRRSVVRALDCGTGTVLIGCGVALAVEGRR
jgi:threonine/homoserine/homoserine lactone efflux protein